MDFNTIFEKAFKEPEFQYLRSDKIDIARLENIGTELDPQEVFVEYKNVSCNLQFVTLDNPDPNSVDRRPTIKTINIHCDSDIDLRNNDKITAYKLSSEGDLLQRTYEGVIGQPSVTQSGITAMMTIDGG